MTIFTNKSVVLVGNSVEMMQHNYGDFIDSHDIVVRLGRGHKTEGHEKSLGTKVDAWGTGFLREPLHRVPDLKNIPILLNRNRISISKPRKHKMNKDLVTEVFSDKELLALDKEYHFDRKNNERMSNGLVILLYFLKKETSWKEFTLIGFDGFTKSLSFKVGLAKPYSWHMPANTVSWHPHNGRKEIDIILSETKDMENFRWIVLSDFSKQDVF